MAAVDALELGVQAYLAELSDEEFARLIAVVRPNQSVQQGVTL